MMLILVVCFYTLTVSAVLSTLSDFPLICSLVRGKEGQCRQRQICSGAMIPSKNHLGRPLVASLITQSMIIREMARLSFPAFPHMEPLAMLSIVPRTTLVVLHTCLSGCW